MKKSILKAVLNRFLGFGVLVAIIFPFYAQLFVEWKPGMLPWFVAGCLVAGLMIGVANYWILKIVLLKKLGRIAEVSNAISQKDLTFRCSIESNDSIGVIVRSFNSMTQTLREIIADTGKLSHKVHADSEGINRSMTQVLDRLSAQSTVVQDISRGMDRISDRVSDISASSHSTLERAQESLQQAANGERVVQEVAAGMERLADVVRQAAESVAELETSSGRIGAIVAVINDISSQTSLLALNAAIEAARAGEQGRGFAVVADEVRKLAERTLAATTEISEMVASVQSQTGNTVRAMEGSTGEVQANLSRTREAASSLQLIVAGSKEVSRLMQSVADSTEEQNAEVGQARNNLSRMAEHSDEALEMTRSCAESVKEMEGVAASLKEVVSGFRLS